MKVWITHKEAMRFETGSDMPVTVRMSDPAGLSAGEACGETPKHLFLQSVAGCTGIDVVMVLDKMRVPVPQGFRIEVEAPLTEEHPKVFSSFSLTYLFEGEADPEKIVRAVKLSQEKYCGISAMFRRIAPLSWRVMLNGVEIARGE
ncbi:MAG TPA: OsmC family protein [bacterium]|nr:OsmC family protein [bacterium]